MDVISNIINHSLDISWWTWMLIEYCICCVSYHSALVWYPNQLQLDSFTANLLMNSMLNQNWIRLHGWSLLYIYFPGGLIETSKKNSYCSTLYFLELGLSIIKWIGVAAKNCETPSQRVTRAWERVGGGVRFSSTVLFTAQPKQGRREEKSHAKTSIEWTHRSNYLQPFDLIATNRYW